MPLARYFLYVGSVLFALLFLVDAWLPKAPAAGRKIAPLPTIQIYAGDKWPQRIVFDTSAPMTHVTQIADSESINPPALPPPTGVIPPVLREALAQLRPSEADAPQLSKDAKQEPKRQRKIARKHIARSVVLAARRSPYGWFGPRIW